MKLFIVSIFRLGYIIQIFHVGYSLFLQLIKDCQCLYGLNDNLDNKETRKLKHVTSCLVRTCKIKHTSIIYLYQRIDMMPENAMYV